MSCIIRLSMNIDRNYRYEQLVKHRFASHVCQTLLSVAGVTISREVSIVASRLTSQLINEYKTRGVLAVSSSEVEDTGELRSMTQLVLDICEVGKIQLALLHNQLIVCRKSCPCSLR